MKAFAHFNLYSESGCFTLPCGPLYPTFPYLSLFIIIVDQTWHILFYVVCIGKSDKDIDVDVEESVDKTIRISSEDIVCSRVELLVKKITAQNILGTINVDREIG